MERFLNLEALGGATCPSPPVKSRGTYHIPAMKAAILTNTPEIPHCHSANSAASILPGSLGSPSGSSFLSMPPEAVRVLDSLSCTKCSKTFSSVSNRNKHMREGCSFREKRGYKCRNDNCTRVLSTRWYRNTHEQTRCRFR